MCCAMSVAACESQKRLKFVTDGNELRTPYSSHKCPVLLMPGRACLRILWPCTLLEWLNKEQCSFCYLLGTMTRCNAKHCDSMTVAAVVGVLSSDHDPWEVNQALNGTQIQLTANQETFDAQPVVLGVWTAENAADDGTGPTIQHQQLQTGDVWLAMQGSQPLAGVLDCQRQYGRRKLHLAPFCIVQHSTLPPGTSSIQVFLYNSKATPYCRRPQKQPAAPAWMQKQPGAVSIASLLEMLQHAHQCIQQYQHGEDEQQQQQQQHSQLPEQQCMGHHHQAPQHIHQPDLFASKEASNIHGNRNLHSWHVLAPLLAWPDDSSTSTSTSRRPKQVTPMFRCWAPAGLKHFFFGNSAWALEANQHVKNLSSDVLPGLLQHLLGLLVAALLISHHQQLLGLGAAVGRYAQHRVLQPHIEWLREAHPGGIKLHFELSFLLATAAEFALTAAGAAYDAIWFLVGPAALHIIAGVAAVGGAVPGLAAAADVLLILSWPMLLVYVCLTALYRLHLQCLKTTWRLLRGKQKVRRFSERRQQQEQQQAAATASAAATQQEAASGDEVSVEQLIVGVLLFTPLLGLMPTTAAWYLSACYCHGITTLLRLLLVRVAVLLRLQSLQVIIWRWLSPQQFPGQLVVQLLWKPTDKLWGASNEGENSDEAGSDEGRRRSLSDNHSFSMQSHQEDRLCEQNMRGKGGLLQSYYLITHMPMQYTEVLHLNDGTSASHSVPTLGSWGLLTSWCKTCVCGGYWGLELLMIEW